MISMITNAFAVFSPLYIKDIKFRSRGELENQQVTKRDLTTRFVREIKFSFYLYFVRYTLIISFSGMDITSD